MDGRTGKDAHLIGWHIEDAGSVKNRIKKHGECAEDDHCGHRHGCLIRFWTNSAIDTHHRRRAADGTSAGRQQGNAPVHLEESAHKHTEKDGHYHYNGIDDDSRQSDSGDVLKSELEPIENDTYAQDSLRAENDARCPCFGQIITQTVGIEHAKNNTNNHR